MAENLKTTKYNDGTAIPYVTDGTIWAGLTSGAYCYFTNNTSFGVTYGGLYNFFAVMDSRKLCPTGWHVPSYAEWSNLRDYLGGESVAGGKMKEEGTTHWSSPNTGADNSSGFTALAASWRGETGPYYYWVGHSTNWWSSSEYDIDDAWSCGNQLDSSICSLIYGPYFMKKAGLSVRCLKN